jgi:perosamine synthetase
MSTRTFLPYGRQYIADEDIEAVAEALRRDFITQGPTIAQFEDAVADYTGARHVVAFANGTAALHGAAFAAGVAEGDDAVTTPLSFSGSSNCVRYQGGMPKFVDISPETWNLDMAAAAKAVGERTKAVIPVSFAGLPVDFTPLEPVRDRVVVIEDACHALGGVREGTPVGAPGGADMTVFSTHPVKAITSGEGGLVATEDDTLARKLRTFRTHGITKENVNPGPTEGGWYYEIQELGFNYRITDFQCALGLSQLQRLDDNVTARNKIATQYRELLADEERVELPPAAPAGSLHAYHLFVIRVRAGAEVRLAVYDALHAAGIGVQVHYIPIYRLPYYRDTLNFAQNECPVTEEYYAGALSLPIFPGLAKSDVERVVHELREALA